MNGTLKKWTSLFRGYQHRWVILTNDGCLKYYETEPDDLTEPPRGQIKLSFAEIERKDDKRFKVISNEGQKFSFRAENEEEADQWIAVIEDIKSGARDDLSDEEEKEEEDETDSVQDGEGNKEVVTQEETNFERRFTSLKGVVKTIMSQEQVTAQFRRLMIDSKRKNFQVVAAIDFGSSYTCCAFSFKSEYKKDPLDIHVVTIDESHKEPTILLLNQEGQFDSFGSKAEEKLTQLQQEDPDGANDWYLFRNFKMQLYNNKSLSKLLKFKDLGGKSMKADYVFALCIEYIYNMVVEKIFDKDSSLKDYDIRWVLTCPAMWNESARQFMLEAAEESGIDRKSITLVLEPEAAAICCKCLETDKKLKGTKGTHVFATGSRFLIVDLGGGAVDITANEVLDSGQLKEIYNASGGPWGGNMINHKIWIVIYDFFGNAVVQNFMKEHGDDYLQMIRAVEEEKKDYDFDERFYVDVPDSLLDEAKKLNADLVYDKNKDAVKMVKGRLQIEKKMVNAIFKECIDTLCKNIKDLLSKKETEDVSSLIMVGGYSSCTLLQKTLKDMFSDLKIIYPPDPETTVIKGAVIMGHMNTPIARRLARYHYGIAINSELDLVESFNGSLAEQTDTEPEFLAFIKKLDPIKVNDVIAEYDVPVSSGQEKVIIEVYASDSNVPPKVVSDAHCRKIGTIRIKMSNINDDTMLKVGMSCDGTEFKAVARDYTTGRCFAGICRFLE
ncbi:heat shock 70 kDa protein 12A-like isoform X1 [Mytilus edulis]|uniref:heat shock 70 kDa protein 12A-like isoform X1 n=1 Tax=Mytilus edulis TaxID=6550 RepID=UPI0039EE7491